MLVTDIVRRVRESAGDVSVLQFTNATLSDWINDAIREIVTDNSLLQAKANSNTVAGQAEYVLPADIFKMHSVWVDGYKLQMMTLQEWEAIYATEHNAPAPSNSAQYVCYVYAGSLVLSPTPTTVEPIVINYTKMPTEIVYTPPTPGPEGWNPATPAIPAAYHNRIVSYCLAQVAMQDDDFNKYNQLMAEFRTGVASLDHASKSEDDLYPFISTSVRDMGDGGYNYYG